MPDKLSRYVWILLWSRTSIMLRFVGKCTVSLVLFLSPLLLVAQLSPQEADMLAQRLRHGDQIVVSIPMAALILGGLTTVVSVAAGLITKHVNGRIEISMNRVLELADQRFTEALDKRDEDRERFKEAEASTEQQRSRAERAEIVAHCLERVDGKYCTRSEINTMLERAEERYGQTLKRLEGLDHRMSESGHAIGGIKATLELIQQRLPRTVN